MMDQVEQIIQSQFGIDLELRHDGSRKASSKLFGALSSVRTGQSVEGRAIQSELLRVMTGKKESKKKVKGKGK